MPQDVTRRDFLHAGLAGAAAVAVGGPDGLLAASDRDSVVAEIARQHQATVKMLHDWIALPSIAAENRNYPQGAEYMAKLARDAGFGRVESCRPPGNPGVFATLDAGRPTWLAIYFMYDVKQFDPAEWSSPPLEAGSSTSPGSARSSSGEARRTRRGRRSRVLAALHAFKAAGTKLPVNLVLVCEGEEEIGSPNFSQIVFKPEVEAALRKCVGIVIPLGTRSSMAPCRSTSGAKGIVELELVSTGEKWGRGPTLDVHSSYEAQIDSPAWHLVQALNTLVKADGHTPAVEGFFDKVQPLESAAQR